MDNIFCFEETEKFGLRKGIVFYFDDWVEQKTICVLEEIIEAFLLMTHAEFTKKRGTNDYPNRRNIRGGWRKVFHREFDGKDFTETYYLQFDNCAPQNLQTIHACIGLSNSEGINQYLYFQCPTDTEWSAIYQFMEHVNRNLNVLYASAGYEMAINILHYPGSMGYGIRAMKGLKYVNSEDTEWYNLRFKFQFGIPCPNFIQILCPDWAKKIGDKAPDGIYTKTEEGRLFLDILNRTSGQICEPTLETIEARYQMLYRILKPLIVPPERTRFMKKEDWAKRLKRFEEIPL